MKPIPHYKPLTDEEVKRIALEAQAIYPEPEQRNQVALYQFRAMFGRERVRSPRRFIESFLWIKDVRGRLVPFILNQSQRYVLAQLIKRGRRGECWVKSSNGDIVYRREGAAWREEETGRVFTRLPKARLAGCKRVLGPIQAIVLKARQLGISTLIQALIIESQIRGDNISAKLVSSLDQSAKEVFEMQLRFVDTFAGKMQNGVLVPGMTLPIRSRSESQLSLQFDAPLGGKLTCDSAQSKADPGRGGTYQVCHFTEVGEWPRDRDTLVALDQVLHVVPGTIKVIESTARGARGAFYVDWNAAERRENDYVPIFLPWFMRPDSWDFRLTEAERDTIRRDLDNPRFCSTHREESFLTAQRYFRPGKGMVKVDLDQLAWRRWWIANKCGGDIDKFHQEYPAFPEEAFLSSGRPVFEQRVVIERLREVEFGGKTHLFRGDLAPLDWDFVLRYQDVSTYFLETPPVLEADDFGPLIIWEHPYPNEDYVIGGDVSEGIEGGDYAVLCVTKASTGELVAAYRGLIDPIALARMAHRLGYYYNRALLAIEKNNHGYTTVVHLLDPLQYPNVYRRMVRDQIGSPTLDQFGWTQTVPTRRALFHTFRVWFKENPRRIHWARLLYEMKGMVYTESGREEHPKRDENGDPGHDDCVLAMGLALVVRDEALKYELFDKKPDPPKTDEELENEDFERLVLERQVYIPPQLR